MHYTCAPTSSSTTCSTARGVEIDYWSFQALLVTQTLMRGALVMARQFETVDGLSAFLEDLFAMVSAYQLAVPVTRKWFKRIMAQHRMMHTCGGLSSLF